MEIELFVGKDLRVDLDRTFRGVVSHIAQIRQDAILAASAEQEIVVGLLGEASANCAQLQIDKIETLSAVEYSEAVGQYGDGGPITRQVPRWRIVVPFTGDRRIFQSRTSQNSDNPPIALELRENELELFVDGRLEPDKIQQAFAAQIQNIEQHLVWARADCERRNTRLRTDVPGLVRQRHEQVQAMRETQKQIGFPIRHRGKPDQTPVPLTRNSVRLARQDSSTGSTPTPRWVLLDSDYEEALRVLGYWRDSLERAPSIAVGRGEEEIRDLLVVTIQVLRTDEVPRSESCARLGASVDSGRQNGIYAGIAVDYRRLPGLAVRAEPQVSALRRVPE